MFSKGAVRTVLFGENQNFLREQERGDRMKWPSLFLLVELDFPDYPDIPEIPILISQTAPVLACRRIR